MLVTVPWSVFAQEEQGGGSWGTWILILLLVILLVVWWWLRRSRPEPLQRASGPVASETPSQPAPARQETERAEAAAEPDDLTRIEGIGPKIAQLLQEAGIATYAQLAATDVSRLRDILGDAALPMADPSTWPEQAKLAAEGRWEELSALQATLKGGRRI